MAWPELTRPRRLISSTGMIFLRLCNRLWPPLVAAIFRVVFVELPGDSERRRGHGADDQFVYGPNAGRFPAGSHLHPLRQGHRLDGLGGPMPGSTEARNIL